MNKRLQQAIVIALFGLLVIGIALFDKGSSRNQPAKSYPTQQSANSNQTHVEHSPFGDWITHDAAGFFAFWLVIVGVGQAGLFLWQLRYMRQSISDAKALALAAQASAETAKEQVAITRMGIFDLERAYLSAGPTGIRLRFVERPGAIAYRPGDPMEIVVGLSIHNTGRTGAIVTKLCGEFSNILPPTPIYLVEPVITDFSVAASVASDLKPYEFTSTFTAQQYFWGY